MTSGHLVCHDCKLTLHIGAVIHGHDNTPHGFGHGIYAPNELAQLIEAFLAIHLQHRIHIMAEQDFDKADWTGYDALRPMPTIPAAIKKVRTISVGPVVVRVEPIEGPPRLE